MNPWRFSHPNRFPSTYTATRLGYVLSPFWSDSDIRREGTVRYALITRGSTSLGDVIMNNITTYVNDRFIGEGEVRYEATWVLVAQWEGVHPHPHGSDNHEGIDETYLDRVSEFHHEIFCSLCTYVRIHSSGRASPPPILVQVLTHNICDQLRENPAVSELRTGFRSHETYS